MSKSEPDPGLVFHLRFASPSHSYIRVRAFIIEALLIIEDSLQYVDADEYMQNFRMRQLLVMKMTKQLPCNLKTYRLLGTFTQDTEI